MQLSLDIWIHKILPYTNIEDVVSMTSSSKWWHKTSSPIYRFWFKNNFGDVCLEEPYFEIIGDEKWKKACQMLASWPRIGSLVQNQRHQACRVVAKYEDCILVSTNGTTTWMLKKTLEKFQPNAFIHTCLCEHPWRLEFKKVISQNYASIIDSIPFPGQHLSENIFRYWKSLQIPPLFWYSPYIIQSPRVGTTLMVMDFVQKWYASKIVEISEKNPLKIKITYCGWSTKWDKWLHIYDEAVRMLPLKDNAQTGKSDIEVGFWEYPRAVFLPF